MPNNKSQHFVPRCVLRPFSEGSEGKIICMYNQARDLPVQQASVAGQCQKSYFYGRDLEIERGLQELEGLYAQTLKKLREQPREIIEDDLRYLLDFAFLQQNRTELTLKRRMTMMDVGYRAMMEGFEGLEGAEIPRPNDDPRHHARENIRIWTAGRRMLRDLAVMVVENQTREQFVISDHPAILLNRLHQQRSPGKSFGIISSGTQIFMPLTPDRYLIGYDPGVYAAPGKTGLTMRITREKDVLALNELQFVNCDKNIYFSRWGDRARLRTRFKECERNRVANPVKIWVGVENGESVRGTEYRRATEEELRSPVPKIFSHSMVYPEPRNWFSGLTFRSKMLGFYNGAAVGLVRPVFRAEHPDAGLRPVWIDQALLDQLSSDPETGYVREEPKGARQAAGADV